MNKSAEEAEREVEASRGELDRTVEALKDKMTPGQLLDEATRTMGDAGTQIFSKFIDQAKENPMPLAVMGLGLAWLMTSNNKGGRSGGVTVNTYDPMAPTSYDYDSVGGTGASGRGMMDKARDMAGGVSDKARDVAGGVSDAFSGAAHTASDAAGAVRDRVADTASSALHGAQDAAHRAKAMAGSAADKAVQYGQQAQQTVTSMVDREPLLIGGAGLLAGLAIGAALPVTEAEKRYVAPIKDKVVDQTKAFAQEHLDTVSDATQAAYQAVKEELSHGGEGQEPAERAEQAVRSAAQAVRDQVSGPH